MKSAPLALALVVPAALAWGCVVHVDTEGQIVREERRFTVPGTPDVRLSTFDGSIEVRSWDRGEVLVEIEKRGATKEAVEGLQIVTSQDGNRVEVEVRAPKSESFSGIGFYRGASARLVVTAPRRTDLRARSGDGSVRVEGLEGRIEVRTSDGSIRARDVDGDLVMNTGDGSITVSGARGRLEVDTGDGSVNVSGGLERVKLHTGDGSVVFRAEPETRMTADWEITTGDGGVTLYLPDDFSTELDAHTGDGSVRSDLNVLEGLEADDRSREDRRRSLRGRLGDGGHRLRVRTGDGTIRLRRS